MFWWIHLQAISSTTPVFFGQSATSSRIMAGHTIPRPPFGIPRVEVMCEDSVLGSDRSPDRIALGFEASVTRNFAFLEDLGYRVVEAGETLVRYERTPFFVKVFHGRSSYELGVEIGRTVTRDGQRIEQAYPISYLAHVIGGVALDDYRSRSATTRAQVDRFVAELGLWLGANGKQALGGDESIYDSMTKAVAKDSAQQVETMRAVELRRRVDQAWRTKDYATVLQIYDELDRELNTVNLRDFELGRRAYAQQALDREESTKND
jgi:hypothetical protein